MKKLSVLILLLLLAYSALFAQVSINTDNSAPVSSAMLDVKSNIKGILIPRMTQAEIKAIINPANGLMVFCTTNNRFYTYLSNLNIWKELAYGVTNIHPGEGFYCGDPLTINHVTSGGVAPIDKTVTYITVANIPGETSKCWITSNLGADHQATAVNDVTEASAGWYWQFNRKQGYKHDGIIRTPNTAWMTPINENFNWEAENDPCTLELGSVWRIPTYTEWFNVDASGNWNDWNGPWNCGLKLHAAGDLLYTDGSLINRGTYGVFWCITQAGSPDDGQILLFYGGYSSMNGAQKAYGISLRCIRE